MEMGERGAAGASICKKCMLLGTRLFRGRAELNYWQSDKALFLPTCFLFGPCAGEAVGGNRAQAEQQVEKPRPSRSQDGAALFCLCNLWAGEKCVWGKALGAAAILRDQQGEDWINKLIGP